ncbi:methylated-DNA--[protein]-cysteine S-methyltransferase [Comamonas composti]|uniref:methylated-DNA--[protein]-cysteine S-methyltransferase n=1 Tax=Comamonas composti TaxID=408558 RepID=UPI000415F74D|nr:MGMT family protein [Comamonas composti]
MNQPPVVEWNLETTAHALFATHLGPCGMAWGGQGLIAVQLPECEGVEATRQRLLASARKRRPGSYREAASFEDVPRAAAQAMAGVQVLLAGRREPGDSAPPEMPQGGGGLVLPWDPSHAGRVSIELPDLSEVALDWHGVSEFHRRVYALARAIAPGRTRSYGELAGELGGQGLSRAIGQALGLNPFAPIIPCHRVLAANGRPGGFSAGGGALTKLRMLENEGAALGGTLSLFAAKNTNVLA